MHVLIKPDHNMRDMDENVKCKWTDENTDKKEENLEKAKNE